MALTTRPLDAGDFDQLMALGRQAFGPLPPGVPAPSPERFPRPGMHHVGTFDGDRLVARAARREYHSWFHGRAVPTNGIAGVTVVAERRGEGLLDGVMAAAIADGRAHGEVVSTLFPTAPGIYRRYGYELIGSYDTVEVPTSGLAALAPVDGISLRRAEAADFDLVRAVYDDWAAAQNGPLTRRGTSFPATAEDFVAEFTGVTLAVSDDDGAVVGYACWQRHDSGYGDDLSVEVDDLVAVDARASRALWRFLGGFGSVAGKVRLTTSGVDATRYALPGIQWQVVRSHAYMLRVDDVPGAFGMLSPGFSGEVEFAVSGDLLGSAEGRYRVFADGETVRCEPGRGRDAVPEFAGRGLALLWAGVQTCANLRMAGLLSGPTRADATLDRLVTPRPVHIRDHF